MPQDNMPDLSLLAAGAIRRVLYGHDTSFTVDDGISTGVGWVTVIPDRYTKRDGHGANFLVYLDMPDGAVLTRHVIVTEP